VECCQPAGRDQQRGQRNRLGLMHLAWYVNRHVVCADRVASNTFYLYHHNQGSSGLRQRSNLDACVFGLLGVRATTASGRLGC